MLRALGDTTGRPWTAGSCTASWYRRSTDSQARYLPFSHKDPRTDYFSSSVCTHQNSGPLSCCTSAFAARAASLTKILFVIEDLNSNTLQHSSRTTQLSPPCCPWHLSSTLSAQSSQNPGVHDFHQVPRRRCVPRLQLLVVLSYQLNL